jgi:hypothetical protein
MKRLARMLTWGNIKNLLTIYTFGGLYTSSDVGDWVRTRVACSSYFAGREVGSGAITFADLPIPLYVLASDITNNKPKIWSSEKTRMQAWHLPYAALAQYPFFFQPVRAMVQSPTWTGVYKQHTESRFCQRGGKRSQQILSENIGVSARAIAKTVRKPIAIPTSARTRCVKHCYDGASAIQASLQPGVHAVVIDTGQTARRTLRTSESRKNRFFTKAAAELSKNSSGMSEKTGGMCAPWEPVSGWIKRCCCMSTASASADAKWFLSTQTVSGCI